MRLRRSALLALTFAAIVLVTISMVRSGKEARDPEAAPPGPTASASSLVALAPPSPSPSPEKVVDKGEGTFSYAPAGERHGSKGSLMRYRVAVENGIQQEVGFFAEQVEKAFSDERGWTAGGEWRLQRVAKNEPTDFTIYLASPKTRAVLCQAEDYYTSCRLNEKVVVNLARWIDGVPNYGAELDVYRLYVINHESGHALGHGHELCPKRGEPAPVMQQQTLGLHGCTANAWPYPDGKDYQQGPSGEY